MEKQGKSLLGPVLCWAIVFADIGTSVYYVPGLLYRTTSIGSLAGFFVFLTMAVFVLLALKYAEVTHRFPHGGGVVTVATQALNSWVGALGGMFILVDYFLTAAISCLSGMQYLSVLVPALDTVSWVPGLGKLQIPLLIATGVLLALLGILNWLGISESAKVSLLVAMIAFVSDLAILFTIFTHLSFSSFISLFPSMFAHHALTLRSLLVGFAGSFLAFSGLESISQLAPVMKHPHKKIAGCALLLVVLTIGLTSPLLTMLSTVLLPYDAADPVRNTQLISLLAGHWGNIFLQTAVAISASTLLVFASNTAIIGAYHVFIALARMEFLPGFVLQRNTLRGTPHYAILLATAIPILILIAVLGDSTMLADMYAFGLLGAFTLTCLGLDIVRYRERNTRSRLSPMKEAWTRFDFWLGVLTTLLVALAWSTNLVTKPLATGFGGGVTAIGMLIAYINYTRQEKKRRASVSAVATHPRERLPNSILAVLTFNNEHNDTVIRTVVSNAEG